MIRSARQAYKNPISILLVLSAFVLIVQSCSAVTIELKTGEKFQGDFNFKDGKLLLGSGSNLDPLNVRHILFTENSKNASTSKVLSGSPEEVLALAASASAFEAGFPDAAGIILLDDWRHEYRPDGSFSVFVHFIAKVKKEHRKQWADQVIGFTEGRDKVHIKRARSINPDGKVYEADPGQMKINKPQISPGIFVKYMLAALRIPNVEIGSIVEVEWEIEDFNPYNREFFFPTNYFQGEDPVFLSRMMVEIPKEKTLFWETRNFPKGLESPAENLEGNVKRYTWELREVPPLVAEPLMPHSADSMPYVQASLFEGWEKIHDWINNYWKNNTTPSPELASQTIDLVKGLTTEEEKIAKIYHWIQKNIRYIIIKSDAATLYGSYPAHETVQKQFGCCVDKAMVFSAMLNAVGIKNGPLLINAYSHEMSKRIPNLHITHSISRITRANGQKMYLDSTGYDFRYPSFACGDQGRLCVDPFDRSVDFIPMQNPEDNLYQINSSMTLSLDGTIHVKSEKKYKGEMEAGARASMKAMKPAEREKFLSGRINGYAPSANLLNFSFENLEDIEKPYSYSFQYEITRYPREIADLMVFKVPGCLETLSFPEAAFASRSFPIEYESLMKIPYRIKWCFPE
ncbi:DUF3857 and transglutaminase domain-containing protein [bacterium]|nr:DUF3857 and transglutaminase domain-containing protein [bacterium]